MSGLLNNLSRLNQFIPLGLALTEMLRHDITDIELREWSLWGNNGTYDSDGGKIVLYRDMDKAKIIEMVQRRHGLLLTEADCNVYVLLHECGHAKDRDHLKVPYIDRFDAELRADEYALKRLEEWKRANRGN